MVLDGTVAADGTGGAGRRRGGENDGDRGPGRAGRSGLNKSRRRSWGCRRLDCEDKNCQEGKIFLPPPKCSTIPLSVSSIWPPNFVRFPLIIPFFSHFPPYLGQSR